MLNRLSLVSSYAQYQAENGLREYISQLMQVTHKVAPIISAWNYPGFS